MSPNAADPCRWRPSPRSRHGHSGPKGLPPGKGGLPAWAALGLEAVPCHPKPVPGAGKAEAGLRWALFSASGFEMRPEEVGEACQRCARSPACFLGGGSMGSG